MRVLAYGTHVVFTKRGSEGSGPACVGLHLTLRRRRWSSLAGVVQPFDSYKFKGIFICYFESLGVRAHTSRSTRRSAECSDGDVCAALPIRVPREDASLEQLESIYMRLVNRMRAPLNADPKSCCLHDHLLPRPQGGGDTCHST